MDLTHGFTTCHHCRYYIADASFEVSPGVIDFTGPTCCPKCKRSYYPEDFTPFGQTPKESSREYQPMMGCDGPAHYDL